MPGLQVALLSGGRSSERHASLKSAAAVHDGLMAAGHSPLPIDVGTDGVWRRHGEMLAITPGRGLEGIDVVFPMLHGPFGEDGAVQGLLECLDVPYVGAGVLAGALCMDKLAFKRLMALADVPQPHYLVVDADRFAAKPDAELERLAALGPNMFVKPPHLGSSVGVKKVSSRGQLPSALAAVFEHGPVAIVEAGAPGLEIECSVIGNEQPLVSEPGELKVVRSESGWRDQRTKATRGSINLFVPARIGERMRAHVRELARRAFELTGCSGLARVDFFVDGEQVLINELNTMPGLLPTSVFCLNLAASGISYPELLDRLVQLALERHARRARLRV